jgi:glycolate oxidase
MAKMIPMNMVTPPPELAAISALQSKLVSALRPILPEYALLWEPEDTIPYECDGLGCLNGSMLIIFLSLASDNTNP